MYEIYKDPRFRENVNDLTIYRGLATAEVDKDAKIVKKSFVFGGLNKWARPHGFDEVSLQFFYERERDLLRYLQDAGYAYSPELIDFDDTTRTIWTRYYGQTLRVNARMIYENNGFTGPDNPLIAFPDVRDKIIQAFAAQKALGIIKYNFHAVNMVLCEDTGRLISFDWKSAELPGTPSTALGNFLHNNPHIKQPIAPTAKRYLQVSENLKTVADFERVSIKAHWNEFDPSLADELVALIK